MKERVQSTKPLVLESIIDTAQRSLKITSEFGGLAIPIRNFNKVYNGSTWKVTDVDSEDVSAKSVLVQDDTVHKAMQDVWGRMASNYIDNLISDLQNARTGESTVFDMLRGNFAGSVLTGNWSVIMKQALSLIHSYIASKMDNAAAATALVDYYNGKDNAGVYANNFRMAYRMGRLGSISFDKMMQASKSFRIMSDKGAMRLAYELGKVHGENAKAAEAENKVAPAQKKGKGEYEDYRYASEDKDKMCIRDRH